MKSLFEVKLYSNTVSRIVYIVAKDVESAEKKANKLFPYFVVVSVTFYQNIYL